MQDYQLYEDQFSFLTADHPSLIRVRQLTGLSVTEKVRLVKEVANIEIDWFLECLGEVGDAPEIKTFLSSGRPCDLQKFYVHLFNFMRPLLDDYFEQYLDEFYPEKSYEQECLELDSIQRGRELAQVIGGMNYGFA